MSLAMVGVKNWVNEDGHKLTHMCSRHANDTYCTSSQVQAKMWHRYQRAYLTDEYVTEVSRLLWVWEKTLSLPG